MKIKILTYVCFISASALHAQQWSGNNNTTDVINRTGNIGIGTPAPAAKISFANVNETTLADGLTWHNPDPLGYGIFRTPGAWSAPDYQQLRLNFHTGIILYPGSAYGKSYVDIQGGGLRVTSGYVGIGTASPGFRFHIRGSNPNSDLMTLGGTTTGNFALTSADGGAYGLFGGVSDTGRAWLQAGRYDSNLAYDLSLQSSGGNVGIGTTSPAFKLDVQGFGARVRNTSTASGSYTTYRIQGPDYTHGVEIDFFGNNNITSDLNWSYGGGAGSAAIVNVNPKPLTFATNNQGRMIIDANGNVGIGTFSPNQKLTVNGTIYGKEVKVDLSVPGPDYVFEKDYDLPSLEEIKSYIDQHKHLPEVPSAKEMEVNGINVGEMNMILLKKVEELTLHLINKEKQIEALYSRISKLENQ